MDEHLYSDVIKHQWSATDETLVPSSEVPPPWFADAAIVEAKPADRVDDQPVGFSAFFASSELSSSDGNGFFGEPAEPVEPAWQDDPAVRALVPGPDAEPASLPPVTDAVSPEPPTDEPGPRTFVFVNGVATVVPYSRAEALARGYAVVDYEDEAPADTDSTDTDSTDTDTADTDAATMDGVEPEPRPEPEAQFEPEPAEAPESLAVGYAETDGALLKTDSVEPAVRSADWPAASAPPEAEPVAWTPPSEESLPPWLVSMGVQSIPKVSEPPIVAQPVSPAETKPFPPDPVETVDAVESVGTVDAVESVEPVAVESVDPVETVDAVESVGTVDPVETVEPVAVETVDPVETVDAVESVGTVDPVETVDAVESVESVDAFESDDADETVATDFDDSVVEHPVFAEPAIAEQLVQVAVAGHATTLSASAPEASDPDSVLSWLRGLAGVGSSSGEFREWSCGVRPGRFRDRR